MVKFDVDAACRTVTVHPEDRWLQGMLWKGNMLVTRPNPLAFGQPQRLTVQ